MTRQQQVPQQTVIVASQQSQALPALVNCFCFPGLGQLIQGRLLAAIVWWFLHLLGALSIFVGIGIILWPIIWIACVIDAARYNPMAAQLAGQRRTNPVVALFAAVLALIVFVPVVAVLLASRETLDLPVSPTGHVTTADGTTPTDAVGGLGSSSSSPDSDTEDNVSSEPTSTVTPAGESQDDERTDPRAEPKPTGDPVRPATSTPPSAPRPSPKLIIESWRFTTEHGFVKVAGDVTNNTSSPIENVVAVVTFYTADGAFVKTSEALTSYNPILPGQRSPFEVVDTGNPAIQRATVAFKTLLGGSITAMSREDLNKPTPEELAAKEKAAEDAARARAEQEARKAAELEAAKWRTWTTADGKFKVEAKFVMFTAGTLTLEKKDGNTVDVKLDILCPEDQDFVRQRKWLKPSNEP